MLYLVTFLKSLLLDFYFDTIHYMFILYDIQIPPLRDE